MAADIEELILAMDYTTSGAQLGFSAYVDKTSGKIYYEADDEIEPLPDDLHSNPDYVELPTEADLDLGRQLVYEFVEEFLPEQAETVNEMFRRKGAYGRLKDLLHSHDMLDEWHRYQEAAKRKALNEWAQLNGVEVSV